MALLTGKTAELDDLVNITNIGVRNAYSISKLEHTNNQKLVLY